MPVALGVAILAAVFAVSLWALWRIAPSSHWWAKSSGLDEVADPRQLASLKRALTGVLVFVFCMMLTIYLLAVARIAG